MTYSNQYIHRAFQVVTAVARDGELDDCGTINLHLHATGGYMFIKIQELAGLLNGVCFSERTRFPPAVNGGTPSLNQGGVRAAPH